MIHNVFNQVLTTKELAAQGITKAQLRTLLKRQEILKLSHGIYCYPAFEQSLTPLTRRIAQHAVVLKKAPNYVLSHTSAALWYGAPLISAAKVHVSFTTKRSVQNPLVVSHVNRVSQCENAQFLYGYRVTTALDTLEDCATLLPVFEGLSIANYFLHNKLCALTDARAVLNQARAQHRERAQTVASRLSELCESPLESLVWNLVQEHDLELPSQQVWVDSGWGNRHRVDFAWEELQLILEADGNIKYSGDYGDPAQIIRKERARQRELEQLGWTVLRTDWAEVTQRQWELVARLRKYGVKDGRRVSR